MTDFRSLTTAGAAAAALFLSGPVLAQTATGTDTDTQAGTAATAGSDGSLRMGRSADQITCADLAEMDANAMETTLYYIAGYKRGQTDALDLSGSGGGDMTSSSATGMTGTAGDGTDTTATADATAGAGDGSVTTETDTTTAMNEPVDGSDGSLSGDTAPDAATASTDGMAMTEEAEIDGMFAIPVAQVTVACVDGPEQNVSDVIDAHRDAMSN